MKLTSPDIAGISAMRGQLAPYLYKTPVWQLQTDRLDAFLGTSAEVILKLELFQRGGSFKPRGALAVMQALSHDELTRGVTTVSAGNHAIAVAYAAGVLGSSAKTVMPRSANPARIKRAEEYGAEVVLCDDVHEAFEKVRAIERDEGRSFVHPFDGPLTALGTATLGAELCEQAPNLDAVIVPIGGGGLCAGVAAAVKQLQPGCAVYGVEPEGADSMTRSFAAGTPQSIDRVRTIADSLGAPHAAQYSFELCRRNVDDIVLVDDDDICSAMALLFAEMKLAVEPAGAAAMAAVSGPLRSRLQGKRIALIVCGANIDIETFARCIQRGERSDNEH